MNDDLHLMPTESVKAQSTGFNGLFIIEPTVLSDARGYFMETFNQRAFEETTGIAVNFVQDNQSLSARSVLRGLHYQSKPYAQTKLVRVLTGEIMDVVIDLRAGEPTFGKHYACVLSGVNRKQLFVPKGFAHGFAVTSDFAEVFYKCDDFYNASAEGGINFLDPELGLASVLPKGNFVLSSKDQSLPKLADARYQF